MRRIPWLGGSWISGKSHGAMDLREEHTQGAYRHPWEVARFRFFADLLRRRGRLEAARVLDVGSGDAWFASQLVAQLPRGAQVTCWDTGYDQGAGSKAAPELRLVKERPAGEVDLMLLLDVLEHVEDDRGFLGALVRDNARSGAAVLVSVPAWQSLFTAHDTFLHHYRRYSPAQGRALLEQAGLTIVAQGGLFHSLIVPRALGKARELVETRVLSREVESQGSVWRGGALLTKAVGAALAVDNAVSKALAARDLDLPGLSWWALCEKR